MVGIGGAVAAWPVPVRAQQKSKPVLGFLASNALAEIQPLIAGMRRGLAEAGYVEGQSLAITFRSADGDYSRLPALAAELVDTKVDVIFAQGPPAAHAAKAVTTSVPTVFTVGTDPVASGLVASFARPGGNLTGIAMFMTDLVAKRFSLLIELLPQARHFALLVNSSFPSPFVGSVEEIARTKGVRLLILKVSTDSEVDAAFSTMKTERVEAFITGQDPFLGLRPKIPEMALRHAIPMMGFIRVNAELGAVASYGIDLVDAFRITGTMAGRILKGDKPGDLAVQRPTRFEMVLNLKTARALGISVPPSVLAEADEVIE
jgi:putative ABC transport system substrate-binding protein